MTLRQAFLQYMAQTSETPLLLEIERAEGVFMYGPDGKSYLDLISGIGVSNVGHCHPKVVGAVQSQAAKFMHLMVYGEIVQSPQVRLAQTLSQTLPDSLHGFYFLNSGSEATEAALKLARRVTGRREIITAIDAYHGSSTGSLAASGNEFFKSAYRPLMPGFRHFRYGVMEDIALITSQTAAVIIETIQGEAGVRIADADYFQALRAQCDKHCVLLVCDEIQCGIGRTGTFWAFEQFGFVPDVLLSAKGLGGGMPIGALIAHPSLLSVFSKNPVLGHITTFGGHPVSCEAATATVQIVNTPEILGQVKHKENCFRQHLKHPAIKQIRSCGLMMAAEMEDYPTLKRVIDTAIEKGVLTDWFLYCDNSMRIAPPLIISEEEIKMACDVIIEAINEVLPMQ